MAPTHPDKLDPAELAWLAAIVESAPDAIIGLGPDGTILRWNPAATRIYGYSAAEAIGRSIAIILPEGRPDRAAGILATAGAGVRDMDAVHVRNDGRPIDVSLTLSPVTTAGGALAGLSMIARDVTEARRAARELQQSKERLSAALVASEIGSFRWWIANDALEWDDTLRNLFGLPSDAAVHRMSDFAARVHPDDRDDLFAEVQRCLRERVPLAKEFRIVHPDGSIRWISDKARAAYDDAGQPVYLTGACRDVTARKQVEEDLSAALAAKESLIEQKDLLLREVNHRIKNSLQLVSSLLSLQSHGIESAEARQCFMEACHRVNMVAGVHERLYKADRVDAIAFGPYLHRLCSDIAASAAFNGSHAAVKVQAAEVDVPTDQAIPLALIVNELVTNALKYAYPAGSGGDVRVASMLDPGGRLRITVEDDGVGLPENVDHKAGGGFGMRIVRALVGQLGGELAIGGTGRGACFVFAFDRQALAEDQARR